VVIMLVLHGDAMCISFQNCTMHTGCIQQLHAQMSAIIAWMIMDDTSTASGTMRESVAPRSS
jgi:hypothetical protein